MSDRWRTIVTLRFMGQRFEGHALDIGALAELRRFQSMVTKTAKALWRNKNPGSSEWPKGSSERMQLYLRSIDEGSVAIQLEAPVPNERQADMFGSEPLETGDLVEAVGVIHGVYTAINGDASLPKKCPKSLLPEYARWCRSLSEHERLEFEPPGRAPARVTRHERKVLGSHAEAPYDDQIDVTGHVLQADVRKQEFALWLDDTKHVGAKFTSEQEDQITTALKEHVSKRLRVQGRGMFNSMGEPQKIVRVESIELLGEGEPKFDPSAPRIEDKIAAICADITDEEWDQVPRDLADRLDDYLYGDDDP